MTRVDVAQLSLLRTASDRASQAPNIEAAVDVVEADYSRILNVPVLVTGPSFRPEVAARASDLGTSVPLGHPGERGWLLHLGGSWESPRERVALTFVEDSVTAALLVPWLRSRLARTERIVSAAFVFSRSLTKVSGGVALQRFILQTFAVATNAQQGSLSLVDPEDGRLQIAATWGYLTFLVEHVRVAPGEGILGRVLETRRPLLVQDIGTVMGVQRRPRYRTGSFVAVPLLAGETVIGVAAVADRADGRAFDDADLTSLRTLAAPAALALQNDRLAAQARDLAHAATVDPLTGLFNRRHFHSRIDEEIERARRHALDLALMLIDIDDFKKINDTLGHLAGDVLLKQVADVLKHSVRVFDVCTRYGGEEFAILMPGSSAANATAVAERIRTRVESAARDGGPIPPHVRVTVSVGLAVLVADTSSHDLIARADRALYRAKEEGKNRVRIG